MKPRKLHIEVEPLSDARWRKIDATMQTAIDAGVEVTPASDLHQLRAADSTIDQRQRKGRSVVLVGLVGAMTVAAAALLALYIRMPSDTRGAPSPSSLPPPPSPPTTVASAPSHIETGAARSFVSLGFASLDVGPSSTVTSTGDEAHGVVVVLEKGSVECDVAPRTNRPPFIVQAGAARVRVVGTRFTVQRSEMGTSVTVKHGVVEVSHSAGETAVHEGQTWSSTPAPSSSSSSSVANVVSATPHGPSSPSEQQLYEQAARLEARDPDGALAIYERLSTKNGAWSSNALFAAGRLSADRGRKRDAKRFLETYLERYPNGPNVEDARALLAGLR